MKKYTYLKIDEFQPYGYHMKVDVLHIVKKSRGQCWNEVDGFSFIKSQEMQNLAKIHSENQIILTCLLPDHLSYLFMFAKNGFSENFTVPKTLRH
jgi:hypothetical protein